MDQPLSSQSHSPNFSIKHNKLICHTGQNGSGWHENLCDIMLLSFKMYKYHQEKRGESGMMFFYPVRLSSQE